MNEVHTQVDGQFSQVRVKLTGELKNSSILIGITGKKPLTLRLVVMPLMTMETRWLRSPYVGVLNLSVRKQMSYRASLSIQKVSSEFSTS